MSFTFCGPGWPYQILEPPNNSSNIVKSYAYNFLPEVSTRVSSFTHLHRVIAQFVQAVGEKLKAMGPRKAKAIFKSSVRNDSLWVNRKHTPFGGEEWSPEK